MSLRELARRLLAGEIPTCNGPTCERQEMFPADSLVRVVRCPRCRCEVPMQPEWDHLELKREAYGVLFYGDDDTRLARAAMVLCVMREVGRPTGEARMNLAEALTMTEPVADPCAAPNCPGVSRCTHGWAGSPCWITPDPSCDHRPGIPTPNRPNAHQTCRKCGRLMSQPTST